MIHSQYLHGLSVVKLYRVQGGLVERYNQALQKLIGKSTSLNQFYIDKRGVSPQIEVELGENYLRNGISHRYLIIVSPEQQTADLIYKNFSFDEKIIDQLYDNFASTISVITRVDSLYGELNDQIEQYQSIKDVLRLKRVSLELQTPSEFLPKAQKLLQCVQKLRNNPELLVEDEASLPKYILELVETVGDVRPYHIEDLRVVQDVESFYINELNVHVFRVQEVELIKMHHPSRRRKKGIRNFELKTITVVIHDDEYDPNDTPNVKYLQRNSKNVLELLLELNWLHYTEEMLQTRLEKLLHMTMAGKGMDFQDRDEIGRHRFVEQQADELPDEWTFLNEVQTKLLEGYSLEVQIERLDWSRRFLLLDIVKSDNIPVDVVGHLLSVLFPEDWYMSLLYNPYKLGLQLQDANIEVKNFISDEMQKMSDSGELERVNG